MPRGSGGTSLGVTARGEQGMRDRSRSPAPARPLRGRHRAKFAGRSRR